MLYNNTISALFIFTLLLLLASCKKNWQEKFSGFDSDAWKVDKNGCKSIRLGTDSSFMNLYRAHLIGLSDNELRILLGKPERIQLFERGQSFYYYYFQPGKQCDSLAYNNYGAAYEIRINSLDLVSEVSKKFF